MKNILQTTWRTLLILLVSALVCAACYLVVDYVDGGQLMSLTQGLRVSLFGRVEHMEGGGRGGEMHGMGGGAGHMGGGFGRMGGERGLTPGGEGQEIAGQPGASPLLAYGGLLNQLLEVALVTLAVLAAQWGYRRLRLARARARAAAG